MLHCTYSPYHSFLLPLFLRPIIGEDLESRTPLLELHLPVEHDTGGDHYKVRPPDAVFAG